jgi:hypothetical protein
VETRLVNNSAFLAALSQLIGLRRSPLPLDSAEIPPKPTFLMWGNAAGESSTNVHIEGVVPLFFSNLALGRMMARRSKPDEPTAESS